MAEKRFTIHKSRIIDGAWVINDEDLRYAFTPQWSKKSLISTCNALNELAEENEQLKEENNGVKEVLIDLKKIDSFWDSALLQNHIDNIANILGVDLE